MATPATSNDVPSPREGWRLIAAQMRKQWFGLLCGVTAGLIWTLAKVSVPKLVEQAIDKGIEPGNTDEITKYALLILLAGVVAGFFTGIRRYLAFREARFAEADLRDRMFTRLQQLHFAFHDGQQTGQLMSRGNNDLQQIQNFIVLIPLTISNLVTVLAAAIILLRIDVLLTVMALGLLPLVNIL